MGGQQKSYEEVIEDMVNKHFRSKPKTKATMSKIKWYLARQGFFHYDQKLPDLPGTNEVMDKLNLNEQQDDQDNLFEN
jgi:hypothetical protein